MIIQESVKLAMEVFEQKWKILLIKQMRWN